MQTIEELQEPVQQRLDQYVTALKPELSRSYIAKLIDEHKVLVNGKPSKPGYKLRSTDKVTVEKLQVVEAKIPDIDLKVLYEDTDCVVIEKPVGLLAHSKGAYNPEATVATWLQSRLKGLSGERGGIVHRLDRGTSGVMICAKTPEALAWLQKQFSGRKTKKTYTAIVHGQLSPEHAMIDMPIERNPNHPQTFRVGEEGRPAQTEYHVLENADGRQLVELKPVTGRTHQLRVHLSHVGHPIVGDPYYGKDKGEKRLYLHALSLELTLPNRERKVFVSPLPTTFDERMAR